MINGCVFLTKSTFSRTVIYRPLAYAQTGKIYHSSQNTLETHQTPTTKQIIR